MNYVQEEEFKDLCDRAKHRVVMNSGCFFLDGKKYEDTELIPFAGKVIRVFVDPCLNGASAVCLDMTGEFITNATNKELWKEMLTDAESSFQNLTSNSHE